MSRIGFIADIHIGNPTAFGGQVLVGVNQRGALILEAFEKAVLTALHKCDQLVICGDLFDTSNPSPQLITEVQRILTQGPQTNIVLMGNHDMVSDAPGDHALGPLVPMENVVVHDKPHVEHFGGASLISVPFQVGDCRQWFPEVVADLAGYQTKWGTRVLAFHLGVIDESTPSFLAKAHDAIALEVVQEVMQKHDIAYAFCGNWHSAQKWGNIVQCGALVPTGWDNPGDNYGRLWIVDTATGLVSYERIPGPRFYNAVSEEEAETVISKAVMAGNVPFLTLKGEAAKDKELLEALREKHVYTRAEADMGKTQAATRAAASAVKGASTLNDALAKYIQAMPLDEGVSRERVREMAKKYLTTGGG